MLTIKQIEKKYFKGTDSKGEPNFFKFFFFRSFSLAGIIRSKKSLALGYLTSLFII